ncbi:hypothetical protein F5879DRAFT_639632 [Lentinula edodes]|nr:hypothetical protein F5879DRAFT_639632 [Lentinula edodes]
MYLIIYSAVQILFVCISAHFLCSLLPCSRLLYARTRSAFNCTVTSERAFFISNKTSNLAKIRVAWPSSVVFFLEKVIFVGHS